MERSDTPPPVASPPLQPSLLPRSGLDSLLSKLPGTAVQLYALHKLHPVLLEAMRTPCSDDRWRWALLGFVGLVTPAAVLGAFDLLRQWLALRKQP
jgi:hypothetical protein